MTCGDCTIDGLIPNALPANQRCFNDTTIACEDDSDCTGSTGRCDGGTNNSATCTANSSCPGGACTQRCAFFTSPPVPVTVGGVPVCLTEEITAAVLGTTNVEQGSLTAQVPLRTDIYNGVAVDNPCPRCTGDATAGDGIKGGTCDAGPSAGLACDAGPTTDDRPDFGRTSFDCSLSSASLIASLALSSSPIVVSTGTSTRTLSTANPTCKAPGWGGSRCFCDTCNNLAAEPCSTNADCPISGGNPGVCGGSRCVGGTNAGAPCTINTACPGGGFCNRPGEPTRPHGCVDDTSTAGPICDDSDLDGVGQCVDGPSGGICTIASGHAQRSCSSNLDCGGGAGTCVNENRPCFPDGGVIGGTLSVSGTATPPVSGVADPVEIGSLFCTKPAGAASVNIALGLPGPARQKVAGTLMYAGDVGELTVSPSVPPGATVTSDGAGENDGATAADPVETSIVTSTAGAAGEVSIFETVQQTPPPMGYDILGSVIKITAPPGTTTSPLMLTFLLDSTLGGGRTLPELELRRNGVIVDPCTTVPPSAISPNPCVFDRSFVGDDAQIRAYSAAASFWDVVVVAGPAPTPTSATPTPTVTPTPTFTPASACGAVPDVCRTPTVSGKAYLSLTDKSPPAKNQLQWKWASGSATDKVDFGDPVTADDYTLCVYDGGGLLATLTAPAGGTCATKDCWADKPKGFQYKDKELTPNGIAQLQLSSGLDGKAKIQVKGKGANLPVLDLDDLTSPLTVQLRREGSPICWGATTARRRRRTTG
jgi:hypothetical protein